MALSELAMLAIAPRAMIKDFETGIGRPGPEDLQAMRQALDAAGVEFIYVGGQPGLSLRE